MLTFSLLSELTGAILEPCDAQGNIIKCATLAFATESDVSFCLDKSAYGAARTTKAEMVFVPMDFSGWVGEAKALARVESPYRAIIECAKILNKKGFAPSKIHSSAQICPNCVIPDNVEIGKNCVLHSGVHLYPNVVIGDGTVLHSGAVIGSRGFGFYDGLVEVPHFGGVVIGENCEI
ncbi:MAG: hypothetical protein FWC26_06225, partial [Fibromonadales bacterium]|nr:hypothetical protein [Fibromonadales bacterium]